MSFRGLSKTSDSQAGKKQFRLHPVALLVTLLAIAVMVKAGFWQIDRGQQRQAIIEQHEAALQQPPTPLTSELIASNTLRRDNRIAVTGEFSVGEYFLVDNQTFESRVGYHVVALLDSPAIHPYRLPVNLGWIPLPGRRDVLPEVELPSGPQYIEGRVVPPAERPFLLREQVFSSELPQRIQYLEIEPIAQHLQLNLPSFSVLLNEEADIGFRRDWPVVVMQPQRHYAYAVQWFGLALAALIVFFLASRVRK